VTESSLVATCTDIEQCRDHLLAVAHEVVRESTRRGHDPATMAGRILAAWLPLGHGVTSADHDFELDESTGVEAFAFVAGLGDARAGGVILRLPGEFPDSFDAVPLSEPGPIDHIRVRSAFFEGARAG
jgi:hypothetical protein